MPSENFEIMKKTLPIIYLIDVSDEIDNKTFMEIQTSLESCINTIKENIDLEIFNVKIMILSFSSNVHNLTNGFVSLEDFIMPSFQMGSKSYYGKAINYLVDNVLYNEKFINTFSYAVCYPIIHFFSATTPYDDFSLEIEKANKHRFFYYGRKIVTYFGDDCDLDSLEKITGTLETVLKQDNPCLCDMLYYPVEVNLDAFEFGLINSECITYDYYARDNLKRTVEEGTIIHMCQLFPCSPENSMKTVFELQPVDRNNKYMIQNMVSVKKRDRLKTKICYCIKKGEVRTFLKSELRKINISESYIDYLIINFDENKIEVFNNSNQDVLICNNDDFREVFLRDKDTICDIDGTVILRIVKQESELEDWDSDDEW